MVRGTRDPSGRNVEGTPFDALKTAPQNTQFAIDPSVGLTRERYQWFSNGTLFDKTFFSDGSGEIEMSTGTASTDTAIIRSAIPGQYISQALADPGAKLYLDPSHVELDENNYVSLSNGRVVVGPFTQEDSQDIQTGFGLELNTDGAFAVWKDGGVHKGNSPVPQEEWSSSQLNSKNGGGPTYDPSDGYVLNFPYTWYNNGALRISMLDPGKQTVRQAHQFIPPKETDGRASMSTPNLPVTVLLDNDGDAESLVGAIGGMQYTSFGSSEAQEVRDSYMAEKSVSIGTVSSSPLDPTTEPGEPLYAVKRTENNVAARNVQLRLAEVDIEPDADIYLYIWDTYDDANTLTGSNFRSPFSNFSSETRVRVDTDATDFDASSATFLKIIPIKSGGGSKIELTDADVNERVPLDATRVVTVVGQTSSNITLSYTAKNLEGF